MQHILAFGDSFSDNGFSNGCGYNRLSNGKVWVEHLSDMLDIPLEDRAWCGAQSGQGNASGPTDWSGLAWQVDTYIPDNNTQNILCTLLIGINDVYDGKGQVNNVVGNIISALESLVSKGLRRFLVANLPNITHAPAYATEEYAHLKDVVSEAIFAINCQLESCLFDSGGFVSRHPEIVVMPLNVYEIFEELVTGTHFKVTDKPWNGTYASPRTASHLWWDDWHPMTEAHRKLALAAVSKLKKG